MDSKIRIASQDLLGDVRQIINEGKAQVAMAVNVALSDMYWHIGKRINDELHNERAEYGSQIVVTLSRQLQEEFGEQNFSVKNIRRMMQLARHPRTGNRGRRKICVHRFNTHFIVK